MNLKVLLIGAYGSGNLGDDLLFEIVMGYLLKYYSAQEIAVLCKGSDSGYLNALTPGIVLIGKQDNYVLDVDLLVYGGGTQFFKYGKTQTFLSKLSYGLNNPKYSLKKLTNRLTQEVKAKKSAMLGVGFGPFEDGADFGTIVQQLNNCEFVSVRDQWSLEFAKKNGANEASLGADMAFSSSFRTRLNDALSSPHFDQCRQPKPIGIIVRDWPYGKRQESYIPSVINLAQKLRDRGEGVRFITFSREKSLPFDELNAFGQVVSWCPGDKSCVNFIAELSTYKCLITSRYHGAVFASLVGCPVVGINIDPKIEYFFQQIDMQKMVWHYPFDVSECLNKIDALKDHDIKYRREVITSMSRLSTLSDEMLQRFEALMEAKTGSFRVG